MRYRSAWAAGCVLAVCQWASAVTVSLPYQTSDGNGNQWIVYFQGNLQQQGNQPVFSQAGMITVNGQQPQANGQSASFDEKNKELTLHFVPRNSTIKQTRRIKFDDSGIVRIVDIFDNDENQEANLNLSLITNTNFGVSDSSMVPDPKKKGNNIGWVALTGANRAAMSLFAGKGGKVLPMLRSQPNGNSIFATFQLKVPAKGEVAIVHWHGAFDTTDAANAWIDALQEGKALSDLPADLRKAIVNINPISDDAIGGRELLRGTTNDIVELRGGEQMHGDLKIDSFALDTSYGKVILPATKIAGILSIGDFRSYQLLVTTDGEVFGGALEMPTIPIALSSGQTVQVPLAQVGRIGYRTGTAEPGPWKLDQPMIFLTSGERCLIAVPTDPIDLVTRYGTVKLSPEQIAAVLFTTATGDAYQVYLTDGSRLSGVLSQSTWPLKLISTTAATPVSFPLAAIARVQFKDLDDSVGTGMPTLALLGDDIVSAKITGPIKLVTTFDTLNLNGPEIASITRPQPGQPDVQVRLFDQSTFRGTLEAPTLTVELTGGTKLTVPVAAIRDYENPKPFPSESVVKKVDTAVGQLNADDFKTRVQAEADIVGMGPSVATVLEAGATTQPAEAKERMLSIITRLKKQEPLPPTRLAPPPPMQ